MADDEIGLELMRLYRDLRNAADQATKERIRRLIDAKLDGVQKSNPFSYRGLRR